MQIRKQRRGFTLVELLVVVGIIAVLISILLPTLSMARESANKAKCANNLRQIGAGFTAFAAANRGAFPRAFHNPAGPPVLWDNSTTPPTPIGRECINPLVPPAVPNTTNWVYPNNVPAAVYMLIREKLVTADTLTCPSALSSSMVTPDPNASNARMRSNFTQLGTVTDPLSNLSYSIQNPYPSSLAISNGFRWGTSLPVGTVLAADIAPYDVDSVALIGTPLTPSADKSLIKKLNSPNHRTMLGVKAGQNVLFIDGSVQFSETPFVGPSRAHTDSVTYNDCIYTVQNYHATNIQNHQQADTSASPGPYPVVTNDPADQFMLPWAAQKKD